MDSEDYKEMREQQRERKLKRQSLATELIQVLQGDINYEFELEIIDVHHLRLYRHTKNDRFGRNRQSAIYY